MQQKGISSLLKIQLKIIFLIKMILKNYYLIIELLIFISKLKIFLNKKTLDGTFLYDHYK